MEKAKKIKKEKKKIVRAVAKLMNKGRYNKYLLSINPYLQTLLDPFTIGGCRIPDMAIDESTTFTMICRRTLTVNAQGVCGIVFGACYTEGLVAHGGLVPINDIQDWGPPSLKKIGPESDNNNSRCLRSTGKDEKQKSFPTPQVAGPHPYIVGQINSAASTNLDMWNWNNGLGELVQLEQWNETNPAVQNLFKSARLVSAGLMVEYYGTPLDAKGKFTYASTTRNSPLRTKGPSTGIAIDDIAKLPGAKVTPLNKLRGVSVTYRPQDEVSLHYWDSLDQEVKHQVNDVQTQALLMEELNCTLGGELYVAVDGATEGSSLQATFVGHYEGIPKYSSLMFLDSSPSLSDPVALSHAMNIASQVPASIPNAIPSSFVSSNVTSGGAAQFHGASEEAQQKPMLDSILGNMEGVGQIVDKGMALGEKLSPILEGAMALLA